MSILCFEVLQKFASATGDQSLLIGFFVITCYDIPFPV
jgi:hypothetical protein